MQHLKSLQLTDTVSPFMTTELEGVQRQALGRGGDSISDESRPVVAGLASTPEARKTVLNQRV